MTTPADGHQPPAWFLESGADHRPTAWPQDAAGLPASDPGPATATMPPPPVAAPPALFPPAAPAGEDDDLFDREWDRPRRTNRLTAVLVAGLVAVAGFAAGVIVQKQHDANLTATPTAGFAGAGAGAGRQRAGGSTGLGAGGALPGTSSGAGAGAAAPSGAAASGVPVVVGTVKSISGTTLVVTNFAGTAVTVQVPASATVTSSGLGGLAVGVPVSVEGSKAADGTVTATAVVSHQG